VENLENLYKVCTCSRQKNP